MTSIENVNLGIGYVTAVCLGLLDLERGIEATPQNRSGGWWRRSHSCHAG